MNKNNDCREHIGTIVNVRDDIAYIERVRSDACGGCKACVLGREGDKLVLPANNEVGAKIGDSVLFLPPSPRPFLAILLLFVIPLSLMVVGLIVPLSLGVIEVYSILISLGSMVLGFGVTVLLDKLIFSKKNATVIKILRQNIQGENND